MMNFLLEISSWAVAVALFIPSILFFTEIMLACLSLRRSPCHSGKPEAPGPAPSDANHAGEVRSQEASEVVILVPAHNEAEGLGATLQGFRATIREGDRLVVVADNCSDATAAIARAAGAEVIERFNEKQRGKIYAVEAGVAYLRTQPPTQVLILDADCVIGSDFVATVSRLCLELNAPVQSLYLMRAPSGALQPSTRLAEFAWRIKNWVRPLGGRRLGIPCMLNGSGMIFPWEQINSVRIANNNLAEDYTLGIEMVRHGYCARFTDEAVVTSTFPSSPESRGGQRTRWEHGHISLTTRTAPVLMGEALCSGNPALLGLALDLLIPPLALLALLALTALIWTSTAMLLGAPALPLEVSLFSSLILSAALLFAWLGWGRDIVPSGVLLKIPAYAMSKTSLYSRYITAREKEWKRTGRD